MKKRQHLIDKTMLNSLVVMEPKFWGAFLILWCSSVKLPMKQVIKTQAISYCTHAYYFRYKNWRSQYRLLLFMKSRKIILIACYYWWKIHSSTVTHKQLELRWEELFNCTNNTFFELKWSLQIRTTCTFATSARWRYLPGIKHSS